MLPPVARSLEDEHTLELLLSAGELLLAGDWPPDTGENPPRTSLRHWPVRHDASRRVQFPVPEAQNVQHSPFPSAVAASQLQQTLFVAQCPERHWPSLSHEIPAFFFAAHW
jgi:hypothetical protein